MKNQRRRPRVILCVENSPHRVDDFNRWLPEGIDRLHVVETGNVAMGVIRRMHPDDYIGVMLDFDLNRQDGIPMDDDLAVRSGGAAANALIDRNIDLPVLVHSHNHWGAADMTRRLKGAGFDVVTVRYENLTEDFFREWALECLDYID